MSEELRSQAVLTASEVQQILRLGKNKTYDFLNAENCPVPVIHVDHQIRIPAKQFFLWLDSLSVDGDAL